MPSTEATIFSQSSLRAPPPETRPTVGSTPSSRSSSSESRKPVRDALEHRADERAAVVAQREPLERPAGVRVGVRRALALEVGQEGQALRRGGPALRFADQLVERPSDHVAQPPQRPRRGQHHAHRLPGVRHGVAEDVDAGLGVGPVALQRREDDPRGAEHDRQRSRPDHADPERARLLVAGARDLGRLRHPGQPLQRDPERLADLAAPLAPRDVEQQRPGGVRRVDRVLPRQPEPHVVLREQHVRHAGPDLGLVLAHPQQLRRGEPGQRAVPRQLDQPRRGRSSPRSPRTRRRSAGRSRGSPAAAPARPRRAGRARASGRRNRAARRGRRARAPSRATSPPGSCSAQPGCGIESGYSSSARASTSPSGEIATALTPVVPTSRPTSRDAVGMHCRPYPAERTVLPLRCVAMCRAT